MQVRQEIFDTYWRFATLRQEVFFNKINNAPQPWTNDSIIRSYKFCNAYRARATWNKNIRKFFFLLVREAHSRNISILEESSRRLASVERKHSLNDILRG